MALGNPIQDETSYSYGGNGTNPYATGPIGYTGNAGGSGGFYTWNGHNYSSREEAEAEKARAEGAAYRAANPATTVVQSTPSGTPGQQVSTTQMGTNVRDHTTGQNYVAGSANDPNLFGGPQQTLAPPPGAAARAQTLNDLITQTQQRQAPAAVASPQLAAALQAQGPTFNAPTLAGAVNIAPAAQAGAVGGAGGASAQAAQLGAAERAQAAQLAPMLQAQDSAFRGNQQEVADYLGRLMRGEDSLAGAVAKRQREEALSQQLAMAASARPGQGALAARLAAQNSGRLATELAGREQEARILERRQATDALSSLLGTARGQDLNLSQFNTGQENQGRTTQAGFQQATNLQNAQEANRQQQVGAQLQTQASIASAQNATQAGIANTQANAQVQVANMQAANQVALAQAQMQQAREQFNAGLISQQQLAEAGMQLQNAQFNASQGNSRDLALAGMQQQNAQFNTSAGLQAQDQQTHALAALLGMQGQDLALSQQGQIAAAQMSTQEKLALAQMLEQEKLARMGIDAGKQQGPSTGQSIFGGAAAGAAAGSALGPYGALIGGGLGALGGWASTW